MRKIDEFFYQALDYLLAELSRIGLLERLEELSLCNNPLGDNGAEVIAHWLPGMTSIREIKLDGCDITENGGRALSETAIQLNRSFSFATHES